MLAAEAVFLRLNRSGSRYGTGSQASTLVEVAHSKSTFHTVIEKQCEDPVLWFALNVAP